MNKETRQFILGIILTLVGTFALVIDINNIKADTISNWGYVFMVGHALLTYIGASLIQKSIN